ncbi:winged helix-turn-helix domain-containing protein [Bradyrhizobium australiense]|uniref:AAA family ATPase n=1 Tax=Bradyrhizobium australiense TaxID=2721161 RepID=A0A7Y4GYC2_9BRAD|nr:winged helix-turn-helix domain-containing protein [Bradyrhizobium australiense]NOJ43602.1 AAA family ATPase [Bradyrhizobium australiense]
MPPPQNIAIGDHTLDLFRELLIDPRGAIVPLRPRAWLVLKFLAHRAGSVVSKNELLAEVWGDSVVTEDSLVQAIGDIRRALGTSGRMALRTLPRRGYMLVAADDRTDTVVPQRTAATSSTSLGDRLRTEASQRFVGRDVELGQLRDAISKSPPPTPLYFVHGPGGIGKTTLLERLRTEAVAGGIGFVTFDAAGIPPKPDALTAAITGALELDAARGLETLASSRLASKRNILAIDSFEHLEPVSSWVRDTLLPSLPSQVTVVLAGRQPPDSRWTAHPLWCTGMHCISLDSLSRAESARLLEAHDVAEGFRAAILGLCHGHPLALVMLAAEVRRLDHIPQGLGPDLVRELTGRCVAQAPTPLHRAALEACALALTTTVPLLSDVVDAASAAMLFEWLAAQDYVKASPHGLQPHELVRVAIDEELRWRDPQTSRALQHAINRHLILRLREGRDISRTAVELQFLGRHSPLMQRYFDYSTLGSVMVGPATEADASGIACLRDAALPPAERAMFDHWRGHSATRTLVARHRDNKVCGVTVILRLDQLDDRSAAVDPVVDAARRALGDALHDPGGATVSLISRFNIPEGERRGPNPAMNALQMCHSTLWATEPNLRFYVVVAVHPDHFAPLLEGTGFQRMSGCDLVVNDLPMGCFVHDWQTEPWLDWRERAIDRPPS